MTYEEEMRRRRELLQNPMDNQEGINVLGDYLRGDTNAAGERVGSTEWQRARGGAVPAATPAPAAIQAAAAAAGAAPAAVGRGPGPWSNAQPAPTDLGLPAGLPGQNRMLNQMQNYGQLPPGPWRPGAAPGPALADFGIQRGTPAQRGTLNAMEEYAAAQPRPPVMAPASVAAPAQAPGQQAPFDRFGGAVTSTGMPMSRLAPATMAERERQIKEGENIWSQYARSVGALNAATNQVGAGMTHEEQQRRLREGRQEEATERQRQTQERIAGFAARTAEAKARIPAEARVAAAQATGESRVQAAETQARAREQETARKAAADQARLALQKDLGEKRLDQAALKLQQQAKQFEDKQQMPQYTVTDGQGKTHRFVKMGNMIVNADTMEVLKSPNPLMEMLQNAANVEVTPVEPGLMQQMMGFMSSKFSGTPPPAQEAGPQVAPPPAGSAAPAAPAAPAGPKPIEGSTAVNKATGARMVYRNGQWVPA